MTNISSLYWARIRLEIIICLHCDSEIFKNVDDELVTASKCIRISVMKCITFINYK